MKKKILIIGSSNMDYTIYVDKFPLEGETIFGINRLVQPGGKGANQAAAVAKSSLVDSYFLSAVGNDNDAKEIEKVFSKLDIKTKFVKKDTCTGNATIVVDSNSENEITIIGGANSKLNVNDISIELLKTFDYVILQNEIPQEVNEFILQKCYEFNVKTIYNPAPFRHIDKKLFKFIDYFIVNEIELSQYSEKTKMEDGINELLKLGIKNIIVTLGKQGSIYIDSTTKIQVDAKKVKAIDTVAAGDTYVGYFASSLASGKSIKESLELATKASAITVSRKGSIVSIPSLSEII